MKGLVGRPLKRREDPRLIQGTATYIDDLDFPGMLHAAVLRSPHAHARIKKIDTKGLAGVFTGADLDCGVVPCASRMAGLKRPRHTVLASDRVYFVGHPVAVAVAPDRYAARDLADRIQVDYDPLPAVTDPEAALKPGSPLTHPEFGTNIAYTWKLGDGDIDAALKKADRIIKQRIIKQRIVHQRLTPMAIEPRGCVATWHAGEGMLTLYTSTQIPHIVRTYLAEMLKLPENRVRVVAPEVGGGFGSKLNLYAEEALVSGLAMRLGAPVKWIESRRENAAATTHGRDQIGEYEIAVKKDGTVLAIKADTIADIGSYLQLGTPGVPTFTGRMLCGAYKFQAARLAVTGVFTNKMATDAYRGAGRPEATYAVERLMDIVAAELGLDPVAVRLKNMPGPKEFPFKTRTGLVYDSGNYRAALRKAQKLAGWPGLLKRRAEARKAGRLFGIGLSTYVEICALGGWEWGAVRMSETAKVTVITGTTPHGQGQETTFAQLVADRLGVPIDDIVVLRGDTATAPYGRDTYGSRATALGGTAIVQAADKVLAQARRLGFKRPKDWKKIAQKQPLEASAVFHPKNYTFPFGCHIAAVEIDRDTGSVTIVKYAAVDDCGPQINPLLVEGQVQGGIAQAIGQALFERTVYDENGQLVTGEFTDYAIPRAADIPEYVLGSTVTRSPSNPLGIKGVGEAGTIGATPAVANAVIDALGVRHLDLPLTPEKIWKAMRA